MFEDKRTAVSFEVVLNSGYQTDWEIGSMKDAKQIEGAVRILAYNYNEDVIREYDLVENKWVKTFSLY